MTDIKPTLDDDAVMDFVSNGYVFLEGIVSEEFNRSCSTLPGGSLIEFARSDRFRREVLLHPQVAGVARSLLGEDFLVPITAHHHLYEEAHVGQTWHSDGLSEEGYGVYHLQCYYYPQKVEIKDGPTMILPGSHHRLVDREAIAHYGDILGQFSLTVPAGSVVLTHYGIWHKAGPKLNPKRRGMIKFSFFREADPQRDWLTSSDEVPPFVHRVRHPYAGEVEHYRDRSRCVRSWNWICDVEPVKDVSHAAKLFMEARPLSEIV